MWNKHAPDSRGTRNRASLLSTLNRNHGRTVYQMTCSFGVVPCKGNAWGRCLILALLSLAYFYNC